MKVSDLGNGNNNRKSIFDEIKEYLPKDHKDDIIETRANHLIKSAMHLIEEIEANYSEENADQLKRRLFNSIKGKDPKKFSRLINKIKESRV